MEKLRFIKIKSNEKPFKLDNESEITFDKDYNIIVFRRIRKNGQIETYTIPLSELEYIVEK
jgi:hypothetical protein